MDRKQQHKLNIEFIKAAEMDDAAQVRQLLAAGADTNARDNGKHAPCGGYAALHYAVCNEDPCMIGILINAGADVNTADKAGITPLHLASWHKYIDCMRQLIAAGAEINVQDKDGWTPLHCAAYWGHTDVMRLFIEAGANTDIKNFRGETPADILKEEHVKLYSDHIDELMSATPEAKRLKSEDASGVPEGIAVSGFEFDI